MWRPTPGNTEDTGFSLGELVALTAALKTKSAKRPAPAPMRAQALLTEEVAGGTRASGCCRAVGRDISCQWGGLPKAGVCRRQDQRICRP